jgi:hypothetical protein
MRQERGLHSAVKKSIKWLFTMLQSGTPNRSVEQRWSHLSIKPVCKYGMGFRESCFHTACTFGSL